MSTSESCDVPSTLTRTFCGASSKDQRNGLQATTQDLPNRQRIEVNTLETPDVHSPAQKLMNTFGHFRWRGLTGSPEGQDSADGAKVILCRSPTPFVEREPVK